MKKTFSFVIPVKHICSYSHGYSHANAYGVALWSHYMELYDFKEKQANIEKMSNIY